MVGQDLRFNVVHFLREKLRGVDMADLAQQYGVTIHKNGKINKGWVGQTIDRIAETKGLSSQRPDGADYELKSVHVISRDGEWVPRETIAITMFNPDSIRSESFEQSPLWHKLERMILLGHNYLNSQHDNARVQFVAPVDVRDPALRESIEGYWNFIKETVGRGEIASYSSKGTSSGFVQLRTKGSGKSKSRCPISGALFNTRAFYATKPFIRYVRGNMG